jgi:hypothetical protein
MSTPTRPAAPIVSVATDGFTVTAATILCPWCRMRHTHLWDEDSDARYYPPCRDGACAYTIHITSRARIEAMMAQCQPDEALSLVPMWLGFIFQHDAGGGDLIGVVLRTAIGRAIVWLPLAAAVTLADHLVDVAGRADELRELFFAKEAQRVAALHPAAAPCPV